MTQSALESKRTEPSPQTDEVSFSYASEQDIGYIWPQILPMVEKATQHGVGDGTTPEAILDSILSGDVQLWVVHIGPEVLAGIVVAVRQHVTCRKVVAQVAGGRDMHLWLDKANELLLRFRDEVGARCVEASCRPGMAKRLSDNGWRKKATIMELNDG